MRPEAFVVSAGTFYVPARPAGAASPLICRCPGRCFGPMADAARVGRAAAAKAPADTTKACGLASGYAKSHAPFLSTRFTRAGSPR